MTAMKNMKLFDILRQFRNIEPDAGFTQRSRTEILLSPRDERRTLRGVFTFLHMIETGAAVALVGFFVLILTGSFSPTRSLSPVRYSVIDPQGLHAEAQAIDIQIQLADVEYPQVTSTATLATNPAAPAVLTKAFAVALGGRPTSTASTSMGAANGPTSTTSTAPLSVDQALQQLSH